MSSEDYEKTYAGFLQSIVEHPDGTLNRDQIKHDELTGALAELAQRWRAAWLAMPKELAAKDTEIEQLTEQIRTIRTLRDVYAIAGVHGLRGEREVFAQVARDLGKVLDQPGDQQPAARPPMDLDLITSLRAEIDQLKSEGNEARTSRDFYRQDRDRWHGAAQRNWIRAETADATSARVRELADEWTETLSAGTMAGSEWEQCLRANLPRLLEALGQGADQAEDLSEDWREQLNDPEFRRVFEAARHELARRGDQERTADVAPEEVPEEIVLDAVDAWHDAPRNEHNMIALDDHMRFIIAAVYGQIGWRALASLPVELAERERQVRERLAADLAQRADGAQPGSGFRRGLRAASAVVAPPPTREQIVQAIRGGVYAACPAPEDALAQPGSQSQAICKCPTTCQCHQEAGGT